MLFLYVDTYIHIFLSSIIMFTDHKKIKLQFDTLNSSATNTTVSHAKPVSNTIESHEFNNNEPPATNTDTTSNINTREEHQQTTGNGKNVSDFSNVISSTVEATPSELHNTIVKGSKIREKLVKSVKEDYGNQFNANEEHYLLETESWNTAKTWTNQDQKSSLARAQGELRCFFLSFTFI